MLRQRVSKAIAHEFEEDNYGKSYEGTWELSVSYPSYYEDETATQPPDYYQIELRCYVLGPSSHYSWNGASWNEALQKCKDEIESWL